MPIRGHDNGVGPALGGSEMRERVVWIDEQGFEHALEGPPWDLTRAARDMEAMGWTHRVEQVAEL